nr:MAG: ORF1 [TTV-like mini virus]
MAYHYRAWKYPRRRYRRYWKWRPRKTFRRTFWRRRRRRYKVRRRRFKRKLKKIILNEWQPQKIRKLTVTGLFPLFMCNRDRIANNMTQWLYSTAPEHFASGGGFSLTNFSLNCLYELHQKDTNWWTQSNCNMPMIRYLHCRLKLYRAEETDYVFRYSTCQPMKATQLTYMSSQPSMMMMNKHTIFVRCLKNTQHKKPYKIVHIKPPSGFQNKWYWQHDISNTPLVLTQCAAASFTRYFTAATAPSTTIGFKTLNTKFFIFHNYQNPGTQGWHPKQNIFLWSLKNGVTGSIQTAQIQNIVYLGNPGPNEPGKTIKEAYPNISLTSWQTDFQNYMTNKNYWGNFFRSEYLTGTARLIYTNYDYQQLKTKFNSPTQQLSTNFQQLIDPTIYDCRYNPLADTGEKTSVYLVPNIRDETGWDPLNNKNLIVTGYPLWLAMYGFIDWMKKLSEVQQIDINYLVVFTSPCITPKLDYYVVLDHNFIEGTSPYQEQYHLTASDEKHLYIKYAFQMFTINTIASSGPGIPKLPGTNSVEAHMEYKFTFKVGGCPAPMEQVCNPADQPAYPIPNTDIQTTSLQNPTTPPEYMLYYFDERRGQLTARASKRIKHDWETKDPLFAITEKSSLEPAAHKEETSSETTTSEEEEETTIEAQLQHQRRKQRLLQHRIKLLLKYLKNTK